MSRSVVRCLQLVVFLCLVLATAGVGAGSAPGALAARPGGPLSLSTGSYFGALVNPNRSDPSSTRVEVAALEAGSAASWTSSTTSTPIPKRWNAGRGRRRRRRQHPDGHLGSDRHRAPSSTAARTRTSVTQADRLKNRGRQPVFLRYYHEPEGAYRATIIGSPTEYIAAWKRATGLFPDVGATNVIWVFTTTAYSFRVVPTRRRGSTTPVTTSSTGSPPTATTSRPVKPGAKWNTAGNRLRQVVRVGEQPRLHRDDR